LDKINNAERTLLKKNYKVSADDVMKYVRTANGQTYTGSKDGIKMWDGYANIRITTENSHIPENHISALALDEYGDLWIGTYSSGIVIGVGESVKPFKIKHIPTHDQDIFSITMVGGGLVWVTFRNGGIECFRDRISYGYFPKH
jgi:ligand-binding sensor domain-containing protein